MDIASNNDALGLLTDLYELTMLQAYWHESMNETATFSLFFREMPLQRNFMLACGQEYAARLVRQLHFPAEQVDRLKALDLFQDAFLEWLQDFHFQGDIHCLPEGTPVFPHEPIMEITAPLMEAQLLESLLMNLVHLETVLASKAVRMVLAAGDRPVVDFGMRRMHGSDAALRGVRAYRAAGLAGTSNVLGGLQHDLPLRGTMAHAYIQAHDDELAAFRAYSRLYPGTTLLVDTYDSRGGVDKVIRLARDEGLDIGAIRLDSGNLAKQALDARRQLDAAGLESIRILVSGGLDEYRISRLLAEGAPIDGFGVGTSMGAASDAPTLDLAYKLTEYAGRPRLKNSPGKQLFPGLKQVWRQRDAQGRYQQDRITARDEQGEGQPLLQPVIRAGAPCREAPDLSVTRRQVATHLEKLPEPLLSLTPSECYPVQFSERLKALRESVLQELPDN
ncbi:MAG: nicotinate phosphoribosyltransferase [Pseudomonadales bacterium]|nr:nicotinate phosphoribosyltransferase [Pseudomonadales bacterium]